MGLTTKKKEKNNPVGRIASLSDKVKPIDLSQFAGKLTWKGDPLKLQKKWRNE